MSKHNHPDFGDDVVVGISPRGGNFQDGDDATIKKSRLTWNPFANIYTSEQALEEDVDREIDLERSDVFNEEQEFRSKVGYK